MCTFINCSSACATSVVPEMNRVRNPLATHLFAARKAANPALNTDVPHAWAASTSGPPVSLFR